MTTVHQFKVGDISCVALHEGGGPTTVENLVGRYPGVTEARIIDALGGKTESINSLNCLYIDTGESKILADVGFGSAGRPDFGNVEPGLESIGVLASDIDIVFLTHFHGDHVAGLLTKVGVPAYPNARYITNQAEWDEWIPKWEASDQDSHKQGLAMMKSLESQFTFVNDGDKIADGVTVVALPGHTLGQSGLLVESNGERLIHLVDVLHNAFQLKHTDWHFTFDSDAELAVKTRKSILGRCADENLLTFFYHLPFPGLGHVAKEGSAFAWKPI